MCSLKKEFSYDIYNEYGSRIEGFKITEEKYNEIVKFHDFRLRKEWKTKFKNSVLYAKEYKFNGYMIFLWKEVFE